MLERIFETETAIIASTKRACLKIEEGDPKVIRRCENVRKIVNQDFCIECRDTTYK
jgi:hypothetical protein